MRRLLVAFPLLAGCGAGVPIQLRLDELAIDLSIDQAVEELEGGLRAAGLLPPGLGALPERWPEELPPVCFDRVVTTPGDDVGVPIDLTPDPSSDPEAADRLGPLNDGLVDRIEIERVVLRVEHNTLNIPLPAIELQAADDLDADPLDRRAWWTLGSLGGAGLERGCGDASAPLVGPGEVKDVEFLFDRGGESFLLRQLTDPDCAARQELLGQPVDPMRCKELALRARTRLVLDTGQSPARPHGEVRLRLILVGTFFVNPVD